MEWQPIDTAPQDGTLVLLYVPDRFPDERYVTGRSDGPEFGWTDVTSDWYGMKPTYWAALPSPPREAFVNPDPANP